MKRFYGTAAALGTTVSEPSAETPTTQSPSAFQFLVAAMQASHTASNVGRQLPPCPESIEQAIAELEEHHDWIGVDQDEQTAPEIRIQNVAAVVAAALRLADVILPQISPEKLSEIIAENQP